MHKECCTINKNTEEIRNKLIELGWKTHFSINAEPYAKDSIVCQINKNLGDFFYQGNRYLVEKNILCVPQFIDCGDNEELFFSIAALRDDSNNEQFFICTESDEETEWVKGEFRLYEDCLFHYEDGDTVFPAYYWKKATVKELIEHFKK